MKPLRSLLGTVILLTLCACSDRSARSGLAARSANAPLMALMESPPAPGEQLHGTAGAPLGEQKLIRNAELDIEVLSIQKAIEQIEALAKSKGARVADGETVQDDAGNHRASLTVRVPSDQLDAALTELRQIGKVKREKVASQDVTKAYADLETRLAVKHQTEDRLRQLLATRTGKLSEVLEVERELDRVVGEIEQLLGEKRYYDHRIETSDVVLSLFEPGATLRPGWFQPISSALGRAIETLAESIGALVYVAAFVLPWLLVATLVWWIVTRMRRRSRAKRQG